MPKDKNSPKDIKEGYQPNKIQKGYQPKTDINPNNPPKGKKSDGGAQSKKG